MTFNEFVGIKCGDIDVETGKKLEHHVIYRRAIDKLGGIEVMKKFIPYRAEQIKEALNNGDKYLNTLPLKRWDLASGFETYRWMSIPIYSSHIWELYRKHGITSLSNAQGVCLLKEAARILVERGINVG